MIWWQVLIVVVVSYFSGNISFSRMIANSKKQDITKLGSGNPGMTNVLRNYGFKFGLMNLALDMLKSLVPALVSYYVFGESYVMLYIAGFSSIFGHMFPVVYKFKGGKGVLTSATVIMMVNWQIGLICLAVFVIIVAVTRYVSLGSVIAAITFPCMVVSFDNFVTLDWVIFSVILMVLVIWCHRSNLKRLWAGEERRLSFKKKEEDN